MLKKSEIQCVVTSVKEPLSNFSLSYPLNHLSPTLFSFATDQALVYEVNFAQFDNITININDDLIEIENFQLVVYLVSGTEASTDEKVGATVCNAVAIFFDEDDTRILSYVCNFVDDRQAARRRKFDQWYNQFGFSSNINKVDETVTIDTYQYLVTLLVSKNHPYQSAIEAEFLRSANLLNK